jgi:hypothetical protein
LKVKAEGIDAELGNNGITLHIAQPGNNRHVGTLGFGRATLKWKRAHSKKQPKRIPIEKLIDWLEAQ